eukprot:g2069.t1
MLSPPGVMRSLDESSRESSTLARSKRPSSSFDILSSNDDLKEDWKQGKGITNEDVKVEKKSTTELKVPSLPPASFPLSPSGSAGREKRANHRIKQRASYELRRKTLVSATKAKVEREKRKSIMLRARSIHSSEPSLLFPSQDIKRVKSSSVKITDESKAESKESRKIVLGQNNSYKKDSKQETSQETSFQKWLEERVVSDSEITISSVDEKDNGLAITDRIEEEKKESPGSDCNNWKKYIDDAENVSKYVKPTSLYVSPSPEEAGYPEMSTFLPSMSSLHSPFPPLPPSSDYSDLDETYMSSNNNSPQHKKIGSVQSIQNWKSDFLTTNEKNFLCTRIAEIIAEAKKCGAKISEKYNYHGDDKKKRRKKKSSSKSSKFSSSKKSSARARKLQPGTTSQKRGSYFGTFQKQENPFSFNGKGKSLRIQKKASSQKQKKTKEERRREHEERRRTSGMIAEHPKKSSKKIVKYKPTSIKDKLIPMNILTKEVVKKCTKSPYAASLLVELARRQDNLGTLLLDQEMKREKDNKDLNCIEEASLKAEVDGNKLDEEFLNSSSLSINIRRSISDTDDDETWEYQDESSSSLIESSEHFLEEEKEEKASDPAPTEIEMEKYINELSHCLKEKRKDIEKETNNAALLSSEYDQLNLQNQVIQKQLDTNAKKMKETEMKYAAIKSKFSSSQNDCEQYEKIHLVQKKELVTVSKDLDEKLHNVQLGKTEREAEVNRLDLQNHRLEEKRRLIKEKSIDLLRKEASLKKQITEEYIRFNGLQRRLIEENASCKQLKVGFNETHQSLRELLETFKTLNLRHREQIRTQNFNKIASRRTSHFSNAPDLTKSESKIRMGINMKNHSFGQFSAIEEAATDIQKTFRGYFVRFLSKNNYKKIIHKLKRRNDGSICLKVDSTAVVAVIKLQSHIRGHLCRLNLKDGVVNVQSVSSLNSDSKLIEIENESLRQKGIQKKIDLQKALKTYQAETRKSIEAFHSGIAAAKDDYEETRTSAIAACKDAGIVSADTAEKIKIQLCCNEIERTINAETVNYESNIIKFNHLRNHIERVYHCKVMNEIEGKKNTITPSSSLFLGSQNSLLIFEKLKKMNDENEIVEQNVNSSLLNLQTLRKERLQRNIIAADEAMKEIEKRGNLLEAKKSPLVVMPNEFSKWKKEAMTINSLPPVTLEFGTTTHYHTTKAKGISGKVKQMIQKFNH